MRTLLRVHVIVAFFVAGILPTGVSAQGVIVLDDGTRLDVLVPFSSQRWLADILFAPGGDLVFVAGSPTRVPCDSYIGKVEPGGAVGIYATPCVDHPGAGAFSPLDGDLLYFIEGAGYWDDIWTVPRDGTQVDRQLWLAGAIVVRRDATFDSAGNLYCVDVYSSRPGGPGIYKITPEKTISQFASLPYPWTSPGTDVDIDFDADGNLWVTHRGLQQVMWIAPDGTKTIVTESLPSPSAVAVGIDGRIWVGAAGDLYTIDSEGAIELQASGVNANRLAIGPDGALYAITNPFGIVRITLNNPIPVAIDIKPGSDPNCFNNDGNGVIPVAILSSQDFDAAQVDPGTVQLEGLDVRAVGRSNHLLAHIEDVNGDGWSDLVVQIEDMDGTFDAGNTTATLTGQLFDGVSIEGSDEICVVPSGGAERVAATQAQALQEKGMRGDGDPEPVELGLYQNHPNPFTSHTTLRFALAAPGEYALSIFDITGRLVRQFAGTAQGKDVSLRWDARDSMGRVAGPGVYFYRVQARGLDVTRRMVHNR